RGAWSTGQDATVLAMVGAGCVVMSSRELDTIGSYDIPVKLVLFDDAALGMVANWHELFFGGRNLTSDRRRGRAVRPTDVARVKNCLDDGLKRAHSADDLAAALCAATSTLAQDE